MPERNNHRGRGENDRGYRRGNDDFHYDIVERFGVVSTSQTGWSKELNRVSWNSKEPKYDLREWSPDHTKMHRGVTFTEAEAMELRDLLDAALNDRGCREVYYQDVREISCDEAGYEGPAADTGPIAEDICDGSEDQDLDSISA